MRWLFTCSAALLALAGAGLISPGQSAELQHVAVGVHNDYVRFVFHLNDAAEMERLDSIGNKLRFVLDHVTASSDTLNTKIPHVNGDHSPVGALSVEQFEDGLLVAIDLEAEGSEVKSFILPPDSYGGHRIVMDVARAASPSPAEEPVHVAAPSAAPNQAETVAQNTVAQNNEAEPPATEVGPDSQTAAPSLPTASEANQPDVAEMPTLEEMPPLAEIDDTRKTTNPFEPKSPSAADAGSVEGKADNRATSSDKALKMEPVALADFPAITTADPAQLAMVEPQAELLPTSTRTDCEEETERLKAVDWSYFLAIDLAECWSRVSAWPRAQALYLEILAKDPEFHRARLALADVYARSGQISLAKQAYLHVLETNPPSYVIKEIQARMDNLGKPPATLPIN